MNYLTESNLKDIFKNTYKNYNLIFNKKISGYFPDIRIEELKLIIEFDGYLHYTDSLNCLTDIKKNLIYKNLNYKVVRIPYWIQLSEKTWNFYFKDILPVPDSIVNSKNPYPNGFIHESCNLPPSFCDLGKLRYKKEFSDLPEQIKEEITDSLNVKYTQLKDKYFDVVDECFIRRVVFID